MTRIDLMRIDWDHLQKMKRGVAPVRAVPLFYAIEESTNNCEVWPCPGDLIKLKAEIE